MVTSSRGRELIKRFEGCYLDAYHLGKEKYYTIGVGHYGPDVTKGMKITQERAEELFTQDLKKFEKAVNKYVSVYKLNQNQYDALVSFTFNLGAKNLNQLTNNGKRTLEQIRNKWCLYTDSTDEKFRKGLERRRKAELELFNTPVDAVIDEVKHEDFPLGTYQINTPNGLNVRKKASINSDKKTKYELTEDGRKHSKGEKYNTDSGTLLNGTRVTVSIVVHTDNNSVWGKIPSGWICLSENGKQYVKKV